MKKEAYGDYYRAALTSHAAHGSNSLKEGNNWWWWTRTNDGKQNAILCGDPYFNYWKTKSARTDYSLGGIRPAIWINFKKAKAFLSIVGN